MSANEHTPALNEAKRGVDYLPAPPKSDRERAEELRAALELDAEWRKQEADPENYTRGKHVYPGKVMSRHLHAVVDELSRLEARIAVNGERTAPFSPSVNTEQEASELLTPKVMQWARYVRGGVWAGEGHPPIASSEEVARAILALEPALGRLAARLAAAEQEARSLAMKFENANGSRLFWERRAGSLAARLADTQEALTDLLGDVDGARWQIEDDLGATMEAGSLGCFRNLARSAARARKLLGGPLNEPGQPRE